MNQVKKYTSWCFVTTCLRERTIGMSGCLWKAAVYTGRQAAHQWQAPGQCTSGEADKSWQVRPGLESDHTSPAGANTSADSSTLQVAWHRRKCDLPLMDHDWIKLDSNQVLFALWSIAGEDIVKCSGTMKETEESIYHWDKRKLEFFIVFIHFGDIFHHANLYRTPAKPLSIIPSISWFPIHALISSSQSRGYKPPPPALFFFRT